MKRLAALALIAVLALTGCDAGDTTDQAPDDPGGVGMTYGGKPGIDVGGGFVVPFDGSGPSLGYGF